MTDRHPALLSGDGRSDAPCLDTRWQVGHTTTSSQFLPLGQQQQQPTTTSATPPTPHGFDKRIESERVPTVTTTTTATTATTISCHVGEAPAAAITFAYRFHTAPAGSQLTHDGLGDPRTANNDGLAGNIFGMGRSGSAASTSTVASEDGADCGVPPSPPRAVTSRHPPSRPQPIIAAARTGVLAGDLRSPTQHHPPPLAPLHHRSEKSFQDRSSIDAPAFGARSAAFDPQRAPAGTNALPQAPGHLQREPPHSDVITVDGGDTPGPRTCPVCPGTSLCPRGADCPFVHVDPRLVAPPGAHLNLAWQSLDDVPYARFAHRSDAAALSVAAPGSRHIIAIAPQMLLRTAALEASRRPLAHCAHYYFNRVCERGASCRFVHAVFVDPTATTLKRAPAPVQMGRPHRDVVRGAARNSHPTSLNSSLNDSTTRRFAAPAVTTRDIPPARSRRDGQPQQQQARAQGTQQQQQQQQHRDQRGVPASRGSAAPPSSPIVVQRCAPPVTTFQVRQPSSSIPHDINVRGPSPPPYTRGDGDAAGLHCYAPDGRFLYRRHVPYGGGNPVAATGSPSGNQFQNEPR